jgi:IMP dehydrogenase
MAIAMAMLGGIGIIHKNLTPKVQARHVDAVKHYLNGLILNPVVFHTSDTLRKIEEIKTREGYSFSGFPILDGNERLAGILTGADVKFADKPDTPVTEYMTSKVITAEPETDLQEAYRIMMRHKIGKLPLVRDGRLVGLYSFSDVKTLIHNAAPYYNRDARYRLRVGAAISQGDRDRADLLAAADVDVIVIDSAHGHSKGIVDTVRWLKQAHPQVDVIAGNVATGEGAAALRDAGADAVKVGVGPGSICTTRVVCGVGIPQITAVYEARQALGDSIPIIADGGIRHSGDVPKAIAAGADSVMLGSVLAGTEESPGEKIIHQGRQYVMYRGMGSLAALRESSASRERYDQTGVDESDLVPQGIEGIVPYAGDVRKVMTQFCGGLRSSLGYTGGRSLADLQRKGRFYRVTTAGLQEAHPHDVKIMKEAPNYRS